MAKTNTNPVQVVEKNPGTKIEWRQSGTELVFGPDNDLTINCASRQRDWAVHADICKDEDGNLVIGVGVGRYYVAQVDIPETEYIDVPDPDAEAQTGPDGEEITPTKREALPLDMGGVVLTLWSIDQFNN